jgi:hypothetical protein
MIDPAPWRRLQNADSGPVPEDFADHGAREIIFAEDLA